ncbi:MAG: HAMP domain-containing histidine kinase [Acidobacteriia bacterium]|nr:HAMP domain-containing histidine kinase [Terriglobia bacterium]
MSGKVGVDVALISDNASIAKACQTTLAELFGHDFTLSAAPARDLSSDADLYIWDFVPGETELLLRPSDLEYAQDHLFLVERTDIEQLRELAGSPHLNILLKPVTPATLAAVLGEARGRKRERDQEFAARQLRAERDEMLQYLMQANLKLQEYDQDRTNFLARSLHDFRSPLTAISGYCSLLLGVNLGLLTDEQQEVLRRMQYSLGRLSRLANSMFQLSISNHREQALVLEQGNIEECIDRALQELTPLIDEKRISISLDVESSELVCFDKPRLEQVIVNLLDNACKFTPRAGAIDIKGYPFFWDRRIVMSGPVVDRRVAQMDAPNSFRVDIRDSGPGIPTAHLEKIFEEYTSYSGGQDRSGGGLGLAICRMIIRQHHGRIWAENGCAGAVFSFVLPHRRSAAGTQDVSRMAMCAVGAGA